MIDYLKGLRNLTILAFLLLGTSFAVGVTSLVSGDAIVTRMFMDQETLPPALFPPGTSAVTPGELDISIDVPTVKQRVLYGLTQAPTAAVRLAVLVTLAVVLNRARRDGPFTKRTVRGLRWIGVGLSAGLLATAVEAWAHVALAETITPDRWSYSASLPFEWLFGGFVCFAVAEMVSRGTTLRDELETVI